MKEKEDIDIRVFKEKSKKNKKTFIKLKNDHIGGVVFCKYIDFEKKS